MKFKIDENLPREFAAVLCAAGHEAETVGEERLTGSADHVVFERSRSEDRTIVTLDLDFSNVHAYPPTGTPGVIVIRSRTQDKVTLLALLRRLLLVLSARSPRDQLWIVDSERIRFRG